MSHSPEEPRDDKESVVPGAPHPTTGPTPAVTPARGTAPRVVTSSGTGSVVDLGGPAASAEQHHEITATAGTKRALQAPAPTKTAMPRFLVVTLGLAAVCVILLFVQGIQDIVAPIFLGLNLMIVVYPLQRALSRVMHRYLASVVSLLVVLAVLVSFVWACVWAVIELINALPQYNAQFLALWKTLTELGVQLGLDASQVNKVISEIKPNDVMGLLVPILGNLSAVGSLLATLVMATFFLAMDSSSMGSRLKLLRVVQPRALVVVSDFSNGVRRYWLVTTVFGLIVALADVAALSIIGVPLVWVWGVLSFITNYIPNIGFVIGVVPPALLALLSGGWVQALVVIAVYCVLNFVIQVIIQPKFTGESVGVTPTISFLSLLFWVFILGPLGALLALPATLLLKAFLIDSDPNARWLNLFVASSPDSALPDDEQPAPRNPRKARKDRERKALLRG
ncbi:AI-2E family transporter [Galactobacter valiniphilus]|nr:AI-2E family transporter [Galactobacter valiniphilus]